MIVIKKRAVKLSLTVFSVILGLAIIYSQVGLFRQAEYLKTSKSPDTSKVYVKEDDSKAVSGSEEEYNRVMILMFHKFVDSEEIPTDPITMRLSDFKNILKTLYDNKFRLVSMKEFLSDSYSIPNGTKPVILTFDDGLGNQFMFERNKKGELVVSPKSAIGVLNEFNKTHQGFGTKGVFYLNMNVDFFKGAGTKKERLQYLVNNGFELGNHTFSHKLLSETNGKDLRTEIGRAQYELEKFLPGYKMQTLALPGGRKALEKYSLDLMDGEYKGVKYHHDAIILAAWQPATAHFSKQFDKLKVPRIEATAYKRKYNQLWWINHPDDARLLVVNK